jgi:hypothetical protein
MTRKLENLFELPDGTDDVADDTTILTTEQAQITLTEINNTIDKIDSALPAVYGLDKSDVELDELSDLAKQSFQDLSDLGMQVDSRYASEIFSVAGQMLGHAITAKNAKLTKKLKMIELQLRKAKLDQDSGNADSSMPVAQGTILDRNELLRRLSNRNDDDTTTQ